MYDPIVRNGNIIDGTGAAPFLETTPSRELRRGRGRGGPARGRGKARDRRDGAQRDSGSSKNPSITRPRMKPRVGSSPKRYSIVGATSAWEKVRSTTIDPRDAMSRPRA